MIATNNAKVELEDSELHKALYTKWRRNLTNRVYKLGRINKVSLIIQNSAPIWCHHLKQFENWKYPMIARDYLFALHYSFSLRISDKFVRRILKEYYCCHTRRENLIQLD